MPRIDTAAIAKMTKAELVAALTVAIAEPAAASQHSLSELRAAGKYACGVVGHGKNDDGNFATKGGAAFHAKTCTAMAKALR